MSDQKSGADPYAAVIADLIRKREEIDNAIRVIEAVRGAGISSSTASGANPVDEPPAKGRYLGMSIAEAAKLFLASRRQPMSSAEIAQGLKDGGLAFASADAGNTVGSVLTRRFHGPGDIVRISRGQWGLKEWYPNKTFKKKDGNGKEPQEVEGTPDPLEDFPDYSEHSIFSVPGSDR